jgi:hypothetical protein
VPPSSLSQQYCRDITSEDSTTAAPDAAIQITLPGATISFLPWSYQQSLPTAAAFIEGQALPLLQGPSI